VLTLQLHPVKLRGIYGLSRDQLPARAAFLHPEAAASVDVLERDTGGLIYSDVLRSADASLAAVVSGRGAQPPGYSGHNFGVSVDLDVDRVLREKRWKYDRLLQVMELHGWYCYCRDGKRGEEDWHFNYYGPRAPDILSKLTTARVTWARGAEHAIEAFYPLASFVLKPTEIQTLLKKLSFYSGAVDGQFGPLTNQAVAAFCRAWELPNTTDLRFQRTLGFVGAERAVV
jgi:hypothetical protein